MGSEEAVLSQIRALYAVGSLAGLTDAQLVERFASGGGESADVAFSALVERHGPMVMRVCQASLRNEHDAEDAFQAVFLVLVRKASTLWVRDSLGPWLHAVAMRTSAYAKTRSHRRRAREWRRTQAFHETVEVTDDDLIAVIHEEVARLPDRFRQAVVLCDLEGLSHEEAAGRLGWPVGTVKSRQARGRERIRERLQRRGEAPTDAAFAMAVFPRPVEVSVVRATASAASVFRAGQSAAAGAVSVPSVALARGILRSMTMMNLIKLTVLSILAAGSIVTATIALKDGMFVAEGPRIEPDRDDPLGSAVKSGPRPPAGSLFEMRFAADQKHDADARDNVGYRWVKVVPGGHMSLDGLVTRVDPVKAQMVLVKLDPQNLTERDLLEVKTTRDERGRPAISFKLTRDGSERFGTLTRAHLPEEKGTFKYRLALIVEGVVVLMPAINSEIRDRGIIEFGEDTRPEEIDRVAKLLADAAAYNAPPLKTKMVKDQAEAIREAKAVDLPALAEANRICIESKDGESRIILKDPKSVESYRRALRPSETPPSAGKVAATLLFYRDDELIRKVWVCEGGEWGFERPGTSWTTGSDAELWRLVASRLMK